MIPPMMGRGPLMVRSRLANPARLFDRGPVIDAAGIHGGRRVPEATDPIDPATLFDAGPHINRRGFHGGDGVTEP